MGQGNQPHHLQPGAHEPLLARCELFEVRPRAGRHPPFAATSRHQTLRCHRVQPALLGEVGGERRPHAHQRRAFCPGRRVGAEGQSRFAFILHALNHLSARGRAAIVCFPGIFYRGGAEQKIRQYLVDNNFVETAIALAPNLFFGTSIAVCILVLSKHKTDTLTQFIDASGEEFSARRGRTMC